MPTLEISLKDFNSLMKKNFSLKQLKEAILFAKGEVDGVEGDAVKIDIKDTNRPDLWSTEGIARELKAQFGLEKGLPKYNVRKSGVRAFVDLGLKEIRPKAAYAVVKNVKASDAFIAQLIQLQEKICQSFGRKRKEVAIGVFDFDKVKGDVRYYAANPSLEFVPLGFSQSMSLREILLKHEKGKEYAYLIEKFEKFPLLVDSKNEVLSMPPIINSEESGKITEKTRNLFVDVTGFKQELVDVALKIMCMALADRGGTIESVEINYGKKKITTPEFGFRTIKLGEEEIKKKTGIEVGKKQILELLQKKRMEGKISGSSITVKYPDYRADIMHAADIIEDLLIAMDYNKISLSALREFTLGKENKEGKEISRVREICLGAELQEVLTFTLTSREVQEQKMNLKGEEFAEISNPVSSNWSIMRKSILPELLSFLSKNKHCAFPQKIFEIGKTVELDEKSETKVKEKIVLAVAVSHSRANFNEVKSLLDAVAQNFGFRYELKEMPGGSFAEGRAAQIIAENKKGIIGEVSQKVLQNFGLEAKVAGFEIEI